jgi:hypothetical protein
MAKINVSISEETEKSLDMIAVLDRKKTREKGKRIDFVVAIARAAYDNLDAESFLNVTGFIK